MNYEFDISEFEQTVSSLTETPRSTFDDEQGEPQQGGPQQGGPQPQQPSQTSLVATIASNPEAHVTNGYGDVVGCFEVIFTYEACNDDELDLIVGDVTHVVEICDDGWFVGTCERTGAFGTFPGNFVKEV